MMADILNGVNLAPFITLKDEDGNEHIHYNTIIRDCPKEVKLYAEKELNETEENIREGLEKLKSYVKKEHSPEIEDAHLIAILRCCKYNIKKSKVKLKKLLNVRRLVVKNIKKLDNKKLEHLIDDGFGQCLPWTDHQGRPIYLCTASKLNMINYNYQEMATFAQASLFCVLEFPLSTIKGVVAVIDCTIKSPSMVFQMLNEYRKYFNFEKSLPLRVGRIDFINTNAIAQYGFAVIRPFLSSKILDRIGFHGSDLRNLNKVYHPGLLPDELGGTLVPVNKELFKKELFAAINKLKADKYFDEK